MRALYIHIPFCKTKCLFCSFTIAVGRDHFIDAYLNALEKEARFYQGEAIRTVYVGGGTPSYLSDDQIQHLFTIMKKHFDLASVEEITFETNPESVDFHKAKLLKQLGVNRLSLGVQSWDDRYLRFLGRKHTSELARKAFQEVRNAGHDNINIDIMFSFPKQSKEDIRQDIIKTVQLQPEHISLYALSIEKYSQFHARSVHLADSNTQAQQYAFAVAELTSNRYQQYEISNFCKPYKESRHNVLYWRGKDYIGLGVGAHSHMDGRRFWNIKRLSKYIKELNNHTLPIEGEERLSADERLTETLLFGLRMNAGVNLDLLQHHYGCHLRQDQRECIESFIQEGLLCQEGENLALTPKGRLVLDELCVRLI